jgi:AraC-like DNA-binding protein
LSLSSPLYGCCGKNLYNEPDPHEKDNSSETVAAKDGGGMELPLEKRRRLQRDLLALLENDEIFKDPELSLDKIRVMLGTNRTYISQIINRELHTTFYQLVNTCRLNKAVAMMQNPSHKHTPIRNIAEICGFKSMSAFSSLFKQTYGQTPTEWRGDE